MKAVEFLKSKARRVLGREEERPFDFPDTISIETSYACNLRCVMCTRHFEESAQGMLSPDMFRERILPVIGRFRYVHLTGWGEPLMHPQFAEIARLTKEAGCWVCFTTNGLLLKEPLSRQLIEAKVDLINVSIDGSTPETYEKVRGKGTFTRALDRARNFRALREECEHKPTLQWTYVMMKSTIEEMPGAVELAGQIGYDRFIAKHMETAMTREGLADALFDTGMNAPPTAEERERFEEIVALCRRKAEEGGVDLEIHPRRFAIEGTCLARPLRTIFVDWDGYVSPCCYLNRLDVKPYVSDPPKETGVFGRIGQVSLVDLLAGPEYEAFRRSWSRGEVPEPCRGCLQVHRMHTAE